MNRVVDTRIGYKINLKETHKNTEFDEALFVNVAAVCMWPGLCLFNCQQIILPG